MGMRKMRFIVGFALALGACAGEEEATPEVGEGEVEGQVVQLAGECTVSLQCPSAPTISCNGTNSQCSVGANSVTCNGVTTTCLAPSTACTWGGVTYLHGSSLSGQCSSRIDGVCRTGAFTGIECASTLDCTAKCQFGDWVPRF